MRRVWAGALLVTAVLLSGCGDDGYEPSGPFRPLPEGAPPEVGPPPSSAPVPGRPAEPGAEQDAGDPNVVATGLAVPTGLALLPDGTAVVGERDTGRILQVFPDRSPARELMTVPGVDTAGDGGLLGLAVSPTYAEDGLLYAYLSTALDNRVVRFPIGGTPNAVLTGIPRGEVHNGGGLAFGIDGTLYVGTGDIGNPALATDPLSLAGKVLRIDVFGGPVGAGPVFTSGHRDVTAVCLGAEDRVFAADAAREGADELNALVEGGDYTGATGAVVEIPPGEDGLGGCAVLGDAVFLGALDGQRVHAVPVDEANMVAGELEEFLGGEYGRLRTVVADAQGALWITTSNRDGVGTPAEDDDKVLRINPPSAAGGSPL
ncbi:PQQ-dependent sugar dehydrogenase [Blastococcus goldschmidtiae]|uniref:PQQ-dependent sugar dehydrogenase n=1 Tax=Blastococcus goldschmidtiae TaxID=3075546 RepID=A0ABU2KAV0_9ACTN|nr:PQQ-dependent sugar dehydrogenase [Blastococcus sp. DSM 46792]MDT0277278.1 PQQ-dependent sugar dehydrogenase [Blastococcus sp. DSM 46792]